MFAGNWTLHRFIKDDLMLWKKLLDGRNSRNLPYIAYSHTAELYTGLSRTITSYGRNCLTVETQGVFSIQNNCMLLNSTQVYQGRLPSSGEIARQSKLKESVLYNMFALHWSLHRIIKDDCLVRKKLLEGQISRNILYITCLHAAELYTGLPGTITFLGRNCSTMETQGVFSI